MWLAPGACHAPHQAPAELIRHYDAGFAHGWDAEREQRLARQIAMGLVPEGTTLPPRNEGVPAWDSHPEPMRAFMTRLQAAYAAMLDHFDRQRERLVAFLEASGQLDNTLVVMSDNGASQEGGPLGFVTAMGPYNIRPEPPQEKLARIDDIGGPRYAQQLPLGLGDVRQHAAQALQAEHARRRHPRPVRHQLARGPGGAWRGPPRL